MTAREGYQPSFAWKSILSAREVVTLGERWCVGNGLNIKIWKDRWMVDRELIRSRSASCVLDEESTVSALIDQDTRQWNRTLVFNCFDGADAKKIISTPLSCRLPMDSRKWHWEKSGDYSVRSAYHLLCDEKRKLQPGPSVVHEDRIWKEIWKAPIPNKIKNFMWRLVKNILPTRENLSKKGITLDLSCPLCHHDVESSNHLFMHCNLMRLTLFASNLGTHIPQCVDLSVWILSWLTCKDMVGTQLFCILLWKFWYGRNQTIFKGVVIDPIALAADAICYVHEFNEANPRRCNQVILQHGTALRQEDDSRQLLFTDAGCFNNGHTGWGLVLKNADGITTFSASKRENIVVEPALAEALGVRWALQTAIAQHLDHFIILSDAANVVNCIAKRTHLASIELVAQDCRELLCNFSNVSIKFISRV
jgi:hypothetical protein